MPDMTWDVNVQFWCPRCGAPGPWHVVDLLAVRELGWNCRGLVVEVNDVEHLCKDCNESMWSE